MPIWHHLPLCVTVALVALGPAAPVGAQSTTGAIDGQVIDQSGAVLPGVSIAILQTTTGIERAIVSDAQGAFRAVLLPVGVYRLTATLAGFESWQATDLRVTVGQVLTLRVELAVAGVTQTVNVAATRPPLERTRTHASATVNETAVQHLPVNGRNFLDFALLTPGITRDVRDGDLSFAGQRGTLNSLIVDGADNNNTFAGQTLGRTGSGRAPYQFSQDAVQEFQINSNAYAAEYGRAAGGVINVVTKSGTNTLHGSLFEFYRDKALNATNTINKQNGRPKSPYHYHQFGGTIGGPLRANRDFFFVNYDGQRHTQPNDVVLSIPSNTPSDPLTLAGIEMLEDLAQSWTRKLDQDVFLIKTDHELAVGSRLTVRYNHQDFTGAGFETGGINHSFEHSGDSLVKTRTLNASWSSVSRQNLANELKVQYARDEATGTANSDAPEAVILQRGTPVLFIGRNNFSPRATTIDRVQVADTLLWTRGQHTAKAGIDLQFDRIENFFPGFFSGQYIFQSIASFARKRPDGPGEHYLQGFAGPDTMGPYTRPDVREYSLFAQDEWRPTSDVTFNVGLRYDLMETAAPPVRNPDTQLAAAGVDTSRLEPDVNNWGPRLGVAWSPRTRRFVVRGGAGLFYGRTPAIMPTTTHSQNGVNVVSLRFTGNDVPLYPQRFTGIPAGATARPNIFYIDRDFANPRTMQANAAVEWELARHTSVTLTALFVDGQQLPRSIDRNIGALGERTFTIEGSGQTVSYPFFRASDRPFENFNRVIALESNAVSRYRGLTLDLNRRFDGHAQLRVAYTLGKVVDTGPDATGVAPGVDDAKFASNPVDFEADRAVGQNDQPHRLVVSGLFTTDGVTRGLTGRSGALTRGWWVSGIITAQSGLPYSARVGAVDLNNDGNTRNDLAPGTRRNAFRLPPIVTIDARVARTLPVRGRAQAQIIWEAFNLLNRANIDGVEQTYYTVSVPTLTLTPNAAFGRAQSSAGERIMQLAAKITF